MSFLKEAVRNPLKKNNNGISLQDYRDFIFNNIDEFLYEKYLTFIDYNWENNIDYNQTLLEIQGKNNNMKLSEALKLLNEHNYLITEARPRPYRQPINMRGFNQERTDKAAFNKLKKDAAVKLAQKSKYDLNRLTSNAYTALNKYIMKAAKEHNLKYEYNNDEPALKYNFKIPAHVLFALNLIKPTWYYMSEVSCYLYNDFFLVLPCHTSEFLKLTDNGNLEDYKRNYNAFVDIFGDLKMKLPVFLSKRIENDKISYRRIEEVIKYKLPNIIKSVKPNENIEEAVINTVIDYFFDEKMFNEFEREISYIYVNILMPLIRKPIVTDPLSYINSDIPDIQKIAKKVMNI